MEKSGINGEKFARRAVRAWRLRRQRHIGSSCDFLNLLALHHARLLSHWHSGAAASGAAATFLSMRVCLRSAESHARLLARSGAAAAAPLAAPPAPLCASFGRTAMLPDPASLAGDDASAARYTPQRTRASNEALK